MHKIREETQKKIAELIVQTLGFSSILAAIQASKAGVDQATSNSSVRDKQGCLVELNGRARIKSNVCVPSDGATAFNG